MIKFPENSNVYDQISINVDILGENMKLFVGIGEENDFDKIHAMTVSKGAILTISYPQSAYLVLLNENGSTDSSP